MSVPYAQSQKPHRVCEWCQEERLNHALSVHTMHEIAKEMKKISIALIVLGIIMCAFMADVTAAVVIIAMGFIMLGCRKLRAWRKNTKCNNLLILNFVDELLRDE